MATATLRLASQEMVVQRNSLYLDLDNGATLNSPQFSAFHIPIPKLVESEIPGWDSTDLLETKSGIFKLLLERQGQQLDQEPGPGQGRQPDQPPLERSIEQEALDGPLRSQSSAFSFCLADRALSFKSPFADSVATSPFADIMAQQAQRMPEKHRQRPFSELQQDMQIQPSRSGPDRKKACSHSGDEAKPRRALIPATKLQSPAAELCQAQRQQEVPYELPEPPSSLREVLCELAEGHELNQRAALVCIEGQPAHQQHSASRCEPVQEEHQQEQQRLRPLPEFASGRQLQPEAPVDASNVEQSMASVPTNYTFPCNTQISLCPHVWRGIAAPCGVMVNLGLQLTEVAGEQSFLMGMYHCINPRIVTTGMPSRSRHHQPSRHHTEVPSGTTTRAAAASNRPPRAAPPPARCPSSENVRKDKDAYTIEEVWMLKRDKSTHKVEATWHCRGPLEGGTVPQIPKWPGICKIDILARVCSGANDSIWLKAPYRHVPANYEDL